MTSKKDGIVSKTFTVVVEAFAEDADVLPTADVVHDILTEHYRKQLAKSSHALRFSVNGP